MAAPISFEFERTVSSSHQTGKIELSAGKLELIECLFERSPTSASTPTPYSTTQVTIVLWLVLLVTLKKMAVTFLFQFQCEHQMEVNCLSLYKYFLFSLKFSAS